MYKPVVNVFLFTKYYLTWSNFTLSQHWRRKKKKETTLNKPLEWQFSEWILSSLFKQKMIAKLRFDSNAFSFLIVFAFSSLYFKYFYLYSFFLNDSVWMLYKSSNIHLNRPLPMTLCYGLNGDFKPIHKHVVYSNRINVTLKSEINDSTFELQFV